MSFSDPNSYFNKPEKYYMGKRDDIFSLFLEISDRCRYVLDVGCGFGVLGKRIRDLGKIVYGIEIDEKAARYASSVLNEVLFGDVENMEFPFEDGFFDCIILADILEHLYNPWRTLDRLVVYLKEGGYVIASIPNISYYKIIRSLVRKKWDYRQGGILDITHLRFFTIDSAKNLLSGAGLKVEDIKRKVKASSKYLLLNKLLFGKISDYLTKQYIFLAKKCKR